MLIKRAAIFRGEEYRRKDQIDYSTDVPICSFYRCGYRNKREECQDISYEVCYACEVLNFFILKLIRKYYYMPINKKEDLEF